MALGVAVRTRFHPGEQSQHAAVWHLGRLPTALAVALALMAALAFLQYSSKPSDSQVGSFSQMRASSNRQHAAPMTKQ